MELDVPNVGLLACLLLSGYLSYLSFTPPNAPTVKQNDKDHMQKGIMTILLPVLFLILAGSFLFHLLLIVLPDNHSHICLNNPSLLNPTLFSWGTSTVLFITIVFIFVPIRLTAYAQLGKNFTFLLAKPDQLVTSGIYRYIQHPSYTGQVPVVTAWYWLFLRLDGVAACAVPLPEWVVENAVVRVLPCVVLTVLTLYGMSLRVRDEEDMMKREFGKEWIEWHGRTKRFVPWLF